MRSISSRPASRLRCPNCRRSRPWSAGCNSVSPGGGFARSNSIAPICAPSCRRILKPSSKGGASSASARRAKYILIFTRRRLRAARASRHVGPHDHRTRPAPTGSRRSTIMSSSRSMTAPSSRFNDARRFGMMDHVAAAKLDEHKLLRHLGPEPLGNEFNGPSLAELLAGKNDADQGGAARSAHRRRARQYLCLRGALRRGSVAAPHGRHGAGRRAPTRWRTRSATC